MTDRMRRTRFSLRRLGRLACLLALVCAIGLLATGCFKLDVDTSEYENNWKRNGGPGDDESSIAPHPECGTKLTYSGTRSL